jgi:SAM-dependent methyltransferase
VSYSEAVKRAPPGWRRYGLEDIRKLPGEHLAAVPGEELEAAHRGDAAAAERVVKALFWPLLYELEPELWDRLANAEPLHPGVLASLRVDGRRVLEIGAGGGRLTAHLVHRARELVCIEPAPGLRRLLRRRFPDLEVRHGYADDLPVDDAWADVSIACATLGPDPKAVAELERVTAPAGALALISPDHPEWFTRRGWSRISFDAADVHLPPRDPSLDDIFGSPDPPHELVWRQR